MITKYMKTVGSSVILALTSLTANAYTVDSGATDVGGLDAFVGQTTQADIGNANPATEEAWAESVLGFDVLYEDKTEDVELYVVDDFPTIVAFSLVAMPSHFIVKDASTYVLFQNVASADWGVLDLQDYFGTNKLEDLMFSHVTELDDGGFDIPEPGSLALLGLGLVGLSFARRRARAA